MSVIHELRPVYPGGCRAGCKECQDRIGHTEHACHGNRLEANPELTKIIAALWEVNAR